jgi:hypothetical protein
MIRDITIGVTEKAPTSSLDHQILKISGPTAGGRVYAFAPENGFIQGITYHPMYRAILIENTTQPLRFYGLNTERISSGVQVEVRNSSNVDIHYFKSESTNTDQASSPLLINNSQNINLYGMSGSLDLKAGMSLIRIEGNSNNVLLTCIKDINSKDDTYSGVTEVFNSVTKSISSAKNVGLFYRSASNSPAPTGDVYQNFCSENSPTVANLVANGSDIKWYANAVGGEPIAPTTALISGNYYFASQTVGNIESTERLFVTPKIDVCSGIENNKELFECIVRKNEIQINKQIKKPTIAHLFDIQGRTIKAIRLNTGNTNQLSIVGLKSGIYVLRLIDETKMISVKILIHN